MQSHIDVIPNNTGTVLITYEPIFSALCAIGKAPFLGDLTIQYLAQDTLLEFHSFERWLEEYANVETTIEGFVRLAFDGLHKALGDIPLRVEVRARTTVHAPVGAIIESEEWVQWRNGKQFGASSY